MYPLNNYACTNKQYVIARITPVVAWVLFLLIVFAALPRPTPPLHAQEQSIAPTFTVFATRIGNVGDTTANNHVIQPHDRFVALPASTVVSLPDGSDYQVRITYKKRSVVVPVWDVGPWNTNDDYWEHERYYHDVPLGVPMAQAAYLEQYHDGVDELGNTIQSPAGIDIADGTFWDDLNMTKDDWVQVSFLWLGNDPGPGTAANIVPPPTQIQQTVPESKPSNQWGGGAEWRTPNNDTAAVVMQPLDNPQVPAGAITADNSDATQSDATWYSANCGINGTHSWTYSTPDPAHSENHALWRPHLTPGAYDVQAYIPACGFVEATHSAVYRITHNGAITHMTVDQQASAGTWVSLGTYVFGSDDAQFVELNDITNDSMLAVRFDAIAWVPTTVDAASTTSPDNPDTNTTSVEPTPTPDTTPPNATITAIAAELTGYRITWAGTDDQSGIASYDVQVRKLPNGGWRNWLSNTVETTAWFGPAESKQFAFRVRAYDNAGNVQPWPPDADMDTLHLEQPQP